MSIHSPDPAPAPSFSLSSFLNLSSFNTHPSITALAMTLFSCSNHMTANTVHITFPFCYLLPLPGNTSFNSYHSSYSLLSSAHSPFSLHLAISLSPLNNILGLLYLISNTLSYLILLSSSLHICSRTL